MKELESLNKVVEYKNSKGDSYRSAAGEIFTHLALHSQYHRGQVVVLMKPYANNLPATDYIFWSRD